MIKVSVILAVYNEEEYIEECIDSLVNQTLKEIEIICVDDGSTDSTLSILDQYRTADPRISVYTQKNQYAGVARNHGMKYATGKYLVFLDGDDYFVPDFLEKMYKAAEKYQSEVVMCNIYHHNMSDGTVSKRNKKCEQECLPKEHSCMRDDEISDVLFQLANGWAWDKMFLKTLVDEHELRFADSKTANDGYFTYMAMAFAKQITKLDDYLVTQRINIFNSLSRNRDDSWKSGIKMLWDIREGLICGGRYESLKKSFLKFAMMYLVWACKNLNLISSRVEMVSEIRKCVEPELNILKYIQFFQDEQACCEIYNDIVSARKRNNMPKVSIIIPVYNEEKYLEECLESVCNQTLKDIEIICVDDGSTDRSAEIIDSYSVLDSRVRVIHKRNTGYGNSMNVGLAHARGEYIGIVESDDYIPANMIQTLYEAAKLYNNVDFVKSDFYRFVKQADGTRREIYNHIAPDVRYYNRAFCPMDEPICFRFIMNIWSGLYKRSFIDDHEIVFNETAGASFQDNGFWFKTFALAERVVFLNVPLYRNRRDNPLSSVNNKDKVYIAIDEYDYIRQWVKEKLNDEKRYVYLCNEARIRNCLFTIERIAEEFKPDFYKWFAEDYKRLIENDEVAYSLFPDRWKERLTYLLEDSQKLYEEEASERKQVYDIIGDYSDVMIYGVGVYGKKIYNKLCSQGARNRIAYFVVSDMKGNPMEYSDIPVIPIDKLDEQLAKEAITIVAVSEKYADEVTEKLKSRSINYLYKRELLV